MKGQYLGYLFKARGVEPDSSIFDKMVCALSTQESDKFLSAYFQFQTAPSADKAAHDLHAQFPDLRSEAMQLLAAQSSDEVIVAECASFPEAQDLQKRLRLRFTDQAVIFDVRESFRYTHNERAQGYADPFQVVASYSDIDITESYIIDSVKEMFGHDDEPWRGMDDRGRPEVIRNTL